MSYKTLALADFCKTGSGGTPSRKEPAYYEGGTIPWVKSGELRENIIFDTEEHVTDLAMKKTSVKLAPKGAILLAMYGATVGRTAILGTDAATNQAICHIVPDKKITDRDYLYHCLQFKVPELLSKAIGGAQPNISQQIIKRMKIPVPPLPEQRRIAAILDKANALLTQRRAALAKLDTLLQSTFLTMFGDPLNPSNKNNFTSLDNLADIIMGQSPSGTSYNDSGVGIPLLNGPTEFGKRHPIEQQWTTKPTKYAQTNDILICVRGATAGKLNISNKQYCIGRGVAAIRPKSNYAEFSNFIFMVLDRYYDYFQNQGVGSTFINISSKELKSVLVPNVAPSEAQKFQELYDHVLKLKTLQEKSLKKGDNLFHALQQRAFKGEL